MIETLAVSNQLGQCPICTLYFSPNEKIVNLACHISHQVHEVCFNEYVQFKTRNNQQLECTICRSPIDLTKAMGMELPLPIMPPHAIEMSQTKAPFL